MNHWDDTPNFESMRKKSLRPDASKNVAKFGKVHGSIGRIRQAVTAADNDRDRDAAVHMLEKRARRAMQLAGIATTRATTKTNKYPRILETPVEEEPETIPLEYYFSDNGDGHLDALDMSAEELERERVAYRIDQLRRRYARVRQFATSMELADDLDDRSLAAPDEGTIDMIDVDWWKRDVRGDA